MPRRSSSSSSRSSSNPRSAHSSTSRSGAAQTVPPKQNASAAQAPQRSGMGSALMGGLVSGMAFGAGSEFIRSLFGGRSHGQGEAGAAAPNYILPLLLSGGLTFGAHKYLAYSKYKPLYLAGVFGASFLISNRMVNGPSDNTDEYNH